MAKLTKGRSKETFGAGSLNHEGHDMIDGKWMSFGMRISSSSSPDDESKPSAFTLRLSREETVNAVVKLSGLLTNAVGTDKRSDVAKLRALANLLVRVEKTGA